MRKIFTWIFLLMILGTQQAFSNALDISGLTVNQAAGTVTFNLNWQNSWRVTTVPNNWDAAWVFVKWRNCGVAPTVDWSHGIISTTIGNHTFGSLEPTLSDGSAVGIDAAPNNTGVMLRRNAVGFYANAGNISITLRVTNLPAAGDIDVKVFGIEMVYVPSAAFTVGHGGTGTNYHFNAQAISSEAATSLTWAGPVYAQNTPIAVPATFPKGFKPFYCMKYEISQGQYCGFLNTINSTGQTNRFLANFNSYRNRSNNTGTAPDVYISDRENRAQNFLMWSDIGAYLDWAALRPMTELEYEKACRGLGAVINDEYAWGTTNITAATTISTTVPTENGTEVILNAGANCSYNGGLYSGGDASYGPLRNGVFALPTTPTREAAGATYYGIMEMSGNVREFVISCTATGTTYDGVWGDGNLAAGGVHDVTNWPLPTLAAGNYSVGFRGGCYDDAVNRVRTADRYQLFYNGGNQGESYSRQRYNGGRGVR